VTSFRPVAAEKRARGTPPGVTVRPGTPADAEACASVSAAAFGALAAEHGFPSDVSSVEAAAGLNSTLLAHPGFYSVVAERDGEVVASNFLDERGSIAGVGPLTVSPREQDRGLGRLLMEAVLDRARASRCAGVRLHQVAYNNRSLALYATLGFGVREPIACMQGPPIETPVPDRPVRPATEDDVEACDRLCLAVHGHDRHGELRDGIDQGSARVVERDGRVTGYAGAIAYFGHAVGESTDDVTALLAAAPSFDGPGVLVPVRNAALFRWCLANDMRVVQVMTLMTLGLYNDPQGAYLPSVLY
jgi:predicted N-acetyltransferase YhbS